MGPGQPGGIFAPVASIFDDDGELDRAALVDLRGGLPRPPLLPLSDEERTDVRATFDAAGLLAVPA